MGVPPDAGTETADPRAEPVENPRRPGLRRRVVITGCVALVFYAYAWAVQPDRPQVGAVFDDPPKLLTVHESGLRPADAGTPLARYQRQRWGWYGAWYDQFQYARMARAIGRGHMPGLGWDHTGAVPKDPNNPHEVASFSYGLGYPAIGAIFYDLGFKGDPFVVPDGLLFALSAMLALIIAERVLQPWLAFVIVNALVLTGPFVLYFVLPYGTTLTVVAVLLGLVVVTGDRFDWRISIAFAVAAAFAFAARYTDVVWVLAVVAVPIVMRFREAWRVVVATAVALAATALVVGYAQWDVFGNPFTTPYHYVHNGLDASFSAYEARRIPNAGVGVFLTGNRAQLFRVEPVLKSFPWAVLAPFGLVLLFLRRDRQRWPLFCAALVGVVSTLTYLAWQGGGTRGLQYWILRFHVSWFPLWAILSGVVIERVLTAVGAFPPAAAGPPPTTSVPERPVRAEENAV